MARPAVQFARSADGVELCYEDYAGGGASNATPLLFQHGYTSYRGGWLRVVAALRGRYRCIIMDGRGCGFSGRPAEQSAYTIENYAEDVIAVANAAKLDRFIFVGHSMGGGIGLVLATSKHAARLEKLVLVAPIPCRGVYDPLNAHEVEKERRKTFTFSQWSAYRRSGHSRTEYIDLDQDEWATSIMLDRSVSQAYYDGSWASMTSFRVDPAKVTVPTLMIAGTSDNLLGNNLTDFKKLPNASLHVFHRVSHGLPREIPNGLAEVIADFATHGVHTWRTVNDHLVLPSKL